MSFDQIKLDGEITGVPVTMDFDQSRVVGTATIHKDGTATIEIKDDALSSAMHESIKVGQVHEFSVGFSYSPAHQSTQVQAKLF